MSSESRYSGYEDIGPACPGIWPWEDLTREQCDAINMFRTPEMKAKWVADVKKMLGIEAEE